MGPDGVRLEKKPTAPPEEAGFGCERCGRDIPRLRLGIGPPPEDCDLAAWVTSDFTAAEAETSESMITRAAEAIEALLKEPWDRVVGATNRRWEAADSEE